MAAAPSPTRLSPFRDFDNPAIFEECTSRARAFECLNFVVDFNKDKASCALDLDRDGLQAALTERMKYVADRRQAKEEINTRWINIWCPEKQKRNIKLLADHYGLSPRLALFMCCDPLRPEPAVKATPHVWRVRQALNQRSRKYQHSQSEAQNQAQALSKLDSDVESQEMKTNPNSAAMRLDLNHYRIVNEIWHFISVDWGHRYMSIGYNQLHETKAQVNAEDGGKQHTKPEGRRIWSWLLLCDDNTVISIVENPFPQQTSLNEAQQLELQSIRHNIISVFTQLSKANDGSPYSNPIMTAQVRASKKSTTTESHVREEDSPSLLLYYLFDDWYTSYSLVAKSDHEYRKRLEHIREAMFKSPQLDHVHSLHSLGNQLGSLKKIYGGYNLIIERIINRPSGLLELGKVQMEGYGVSISSAAALRFERLKDRISLYALSEIESCIDEKNSLMSMNFQLIAIKEESYVERLTRITILLAKATILFIPVSIVAAYFGINFVDEQFTFAQFWVSFGVIFFLSIMVLVAFGWLSDTRETGPIYESFTTQAVNIWRGLTGQPRKKSKKT